MTGRRQRNREPRSPADGSASAVDAGMEAACSPMCRLRNSIPDPDPYSAPLTALREVMARLNGTTLRSLFGLTHRCCTSALRLGMNTVAVAVGSAVAVSAEAIPRRRPEWSRAEADSAGGAADFPPLTAVAFRPKAVGGAAARTALEGAAATAADLPGRFLPSQARSRSSAGWGLFLCLEK